MRQSRGGRRKSKEAKRVRDSSRLPVLVLLQNQADLVSSSLRHRDKTQLASMSEFPVSKMPWQLRHTFRKMKHFMKMRTLRKGGLRQRLLKVSQPRTRLRRRSSISNQDRSTSSTEPPTISSSNDKMDNSSTTRDLEAHNPTSMRSSSSTNSFLNPNTSAPSMEAAATTALHRVLLKGSSMKAALL